VRGARDEQGTERRETLRVRLWRPREQRSHRCGGSSARATRPLPLRRAVPGPASRVPPVSAETRHECNWQEFFFFLVFYFNPLPWRVSKWRHTRAARS
jgi:hypothetical protein